LIKFKRATRVTGVITLVGLALYGYDYSALGNGNSAESPKEYVSTTSITQPTLASDFRPAERISRAQSEAMINRLYAQRLAVASRTGPAVGSATFPLPSAAPSSVASTGPKFHGSPGTFVIGRNNKNTNANCATNCSTLAEPSAINDGRRVFASGNFRHAEFSQDGGVTWTNVAYPAGQTKAPTACCDTDNAYAYERGVSFNSMLYINSSVTDSQVRIFVRRQPQLAANCSYIFDSATTNIPHTLMDYPHLGRSNTWLYFNTNLINTKGTASTADDAWVQAEMYRLNIDQMADCVGVTTQKLVFNTGIGQRILTPAKDVRETMYFSWIENTTHIRSFSWTDASASATSVLVAVSTTSTTNPDCRGGTLNNDYTDSLWTSISGFHLRTAVGGGKIYIYWNSGPIGSITQGHVRGVILLQSNLAVFQQPVVFSNTICIGIMGMDTNDRGDLGISGVLGGVAGGGGSAANSAVWMQDQFNPGPGGFALSTTASGTHNRTDQRYGDYFTVNRQSPCGLAFAATGYALSGGTAVSNVNSRYIEFYRNRDGKCYTGWRDAFRTP
jgi:hypothetical protein